MCSLLCSMTDRDNHLLFSSSCPIVYLEQLLLVYSSGGLLFTCIDWKLVLYIVILPCVYTYFCVSLSYLWYLCTCGACVPVVPVYLCVSVISVVPVYLCVSVISVVPVYLCVSVISVVSVYLCVSVISVVSVYLCISVIPVVSVCLNDLCVYVHILSSRCS